MTEQELLAVLNIPNEEQQIKALREGGYTEYFVRLLCGRDGFAYECKTGSLADLAFRLRDELVGVKIEGIVPNYFDKKTPMIVFPQSLFRWFKAKRLIDEKLKTHFYPGNCESWWSEQSQPIHWIIAALLAKESQ